jgi:hypothetical protein
MSTTLLTVALSHLQLRDVIEYPEAGILSKVLLKDGCCQSARCASRASQTLRLNLLTCVLARKGEADSRGSLI